MKYKLLFFFITGMLLASCSKIEDEYVYDTGYAIDWSAAADSASSTLPERFWNEEGYFNYENDGMALVSSITTGTGNGCNYRCLLA